MVELARMTTYISIKLLTAPMYKASEFEALLSTSPPTKSRWRGYYELTRLHKPIMGNTLMFWPCGKYTHSRFVCPKYLLEHNQPGV